MQPQQHKGITMSFLSFLETVESDVVNVVIAISQAQAVAANDIDNALGWIVNNAPAIATDIQTVTSIVRAVGITNPGIEATVLAANAAVAALNTFATAQASGQSSASAVIAGYSAYKQAQGAAAQAVASATSSAQLVHLASLLNTQVNNASA
jgi:hypothetical protein